MEDGEPNQNTDTEGMPRYRHESNVRVCFSRRATELSDSPLEVKKPSTSKENKKAKVSRDPSSGRSLESDQDDVSNDELRKIACLYTDVLLSDSDRSRKKKKR